MRHLFDHSTVKEHLSVWAASSSLVTGAFFYYHLGTSEQKTYEALTRTLLHCILDGTRSFVPELLPEMWKEAIRPGRSGHLESPTHPETEAAFRRLSQMPVKICLFIDGLDEHLGNQQEGISFIQSMIRSGNTKVLASSRPEPNFVAAFSSGPCLECKISPKATRWYHMLFLI